MPSDAFMELSPAGELIGESGDELYGGKSPYEMFEISSLEFETSPSITIVGTGPDGQLTQQRAKAPPTGDENKDKKGKISITKSIDFASPDLFRYCVDKKKKIEWAIVTIREAGESPTGKDNSPWLRLEFRQVQVKDFTWDLDPDATGEAATKMEKVVFDFDTMLIMYYPQTSSGAHQPAKTNGWNFAEGTKDVNPIRP